MENLKVAVLIPVLNAGEGWDEKLKLISKQSIRINKKILIDSGSNDDTAEIAKNNGFQVVKITRAEFNHGRTRQQLLNLAEDNDVCVFLTHDAILASNDSIKNLVKVFARDAQVGVAYGRQLPHKNATPVETHARLFNYKDKSDIRELKDKERLGFKTFFCSNSFAAYRRDAMMSIGGFTADSIMGEDALAAAGLLLAGFKVAYVADATVYHSHNYSFAEEFKRYFDTRVFHEQNKWLIENFGQPTGEGLKYVKSEIKYVVQHSPQTLLTSVAMIAAKWFGYKTGGFFRVIPKPVLRKLSMYKSYWKD